MASDKAGTRRLVVVLPAYNESKNIARVVAGVRAVRLPCVEIVPVVIDDGSKDNTGELARAAGAVVLTHSPNRGVGAGFRTGLYWARDNGADLLLHMDSDGQVRPEEIPLLAQPILDGTAELALGCRFLDGTPRGLASWKGTGLTSVARMIGLLTGYRLHDLSCGFRCMNRRIMDAIDPTFDYDYIQETLIQALAVRAKIVEVPVDIIYDDQDAARPGMSHHAMRYIVRYFGLTAYSMANFYKTRVVGLRS